MNVEQSSVGSRRVAVVISAADNVATALEAIDAGQRIETGGATVTASEPIPRGHKIALRDIRAGDTVVKYGSPIGTASSNIAAGAHVHIHNVASARGRGDRGSKEREAFSGAEARGAPASAEGFGASTVARVASGGGKAAAERTSDDAARLAEPDEP
jgi:altronate dehydratase